MEVVDFLPIIDKFGSWAGPVLATVIGAFAGNWFSQKSLDKQALRSSAEARRSLLEAKAEKIVNAANSAIACSEADMLRGVDSLVRLHFDAEVVSAYESLIRAVRDDDRTSLTITSANEVMIVKKNALTVELNRSINKLKL